MSHFHFAQLSEEQKQQIRQLEEEMGLILIAYECDHFTANRADRLSFAPPELEDRNHHTRHPYQDDPNLNLL